MFHFDASDWKWGKYKQKETTERWTYEYDRSSQLSDEWTDRIVKQIEREILLGLLDGKRFIVEAMVGAFDDWLTESFIWFCWENFFWMNKAWSLCIEKWSFWRKDSKYGVFVDFLIFLTVFLIFQELFLSFFGRLCFKSFFVKTFKLIKA